MIATSQMPAGTMPSLSSQATDAAPLANKEAYHSKWKRTSPVPLTRESFLDLLYGRTPLVKEANFITKDQTQKLYDHLRPLFSPYIHAAGPPVSKVGVAQFEFQAQAAEDFENRTGDGESKTGNTLDTAQVSLLPLSTMSAHRETTRKNPLF